MSFIELHNIHLSLGQRPVFENLNISFKMQQWHGIIGRSGTGKTTLLKLIAELIKPDQGTVSLRGASVIDPLQIAWMPQKDSLLPWLSVIDNVMIGARLRSDKHAGDYDRAHELLKRLNLHHWAKTLPRALSGGMRQRVAIARILFEERNVVLMDEPFSSLDIISREELYELIVELLAPYTVIMVTHDPSEALRLSHCLTVLSKTHSAQTTQAHSIEIQGEPYRAVNDQHVMDTIPKLWKELRSNAKTGHDFV